MNKTAYGFYNEIYDSGSSVQVLQTGDGKSGFNTVYDKNKEWVGIGFSYGNGGGIGKLETFNDGTTLTDRKCKWLIKFENVGSINALIEQLKEIKSAIEGKS